MNKSAISNLFSSQTITPSSWLTIIFSLVLAFAVGLFIAFIYRRNYRGVMYSNNFALTLIMMTLITTPVVMCIRESIQLSMGMVGALSIVRFRTPVKEPMDIVFLFWCIATGIVLAAGLLVLAVFGCAVIGLVLMLFHGHATTDRPYILAVRLADADAEDAVAELVAARSRAHALKAKIVAAGAVDLTYEVRLSGGDAAFVGDLDALEGVAEATLVSYNGDYQG